MKHLFVARRGKYSIGEGGNIKLDPQGRRQMERLGAAIANAGECPFYIVSCTNPETAEGTDILAGILVPGGDKVLLELYTDPRGIEEEADILYRFVGQRRGEAASLVLLSYRRVVERFSARFLREELGSEGTVPVPKRGKAVHFDLVNRRYELIPV